MQNTECRMNAALAAQNINSASGGTMLEIHCESHVELAAGEVVGHGILDVVNVGYPVVAAHVADVEQVEHVES